MIEIKCDEKHTSIVGNGTVIDVMTAYANVTRAVGEGVYKMTGIKELTDDLMRQAWDAVRKDVFGEERDDA